MTPSPALKGAVRYRRYNHYNRDIIQRSNSVGHGDVEKMQVNCWISGEAGERMKALAKAQNISYGQLLTALLLNQPVAVQDWQAAVSELIGRVSEIEVALSSLQALQGGDELRGMIDKQDVRLNVLEVAIRSGLGGRKGKVRASVSAADLEPVGAESDTLSHPADSSILPPLSPDELETLVKDTYRECDNKIGKTMEALREKGHGIGQPRLYKILGIKAWDGSRR